MFSGIKPLLLAMLFLLPFGAAAAEFSAQGAARSGGVWGKTPTHAVQKNLPLKKNYARRNSPMLISTSQSHFAPQVQAAYATPQLRYHAPQALTYDTYRPVLSQFRLNGTLPGIVSDGGMLKVSYQFDETAGDDIRRPLNNKERQVVREVLAQVSRHIPVSFQESNMAYLRFTAAAIASAGIAGFTNIPEPASASLMGGQVVLDRSLCEGNVASCDTFRSVARHEIGHALGLQHPWEAGAEFEKMQSIMSYQDYADYQPADIAALQHLYGAARGSTMLADARAIASEQNAMENIWSAMKSNPAQALKAALSETNPTAPPRSGVIFSPQEEDNSGVMGNVLSRIFGSN